MRFISFHTLEECVILSPDNHALVDITKVLQNIVGARQMVAVMAAYNRDQHRVAKAIWLANQNFEQHGAGCCLHIVLADGNLERSHIVWCLQQPDCCVECKILGKLLLTCSPLERVMVFRANHSAECCSDEKVLPED